MFKLGNIVNDIETKRRNDIRLANHSKKIINKPPVNRSVNRPKMIDKSTMTEVKTNSIGIDTKELETKAKELAVLEKFKKAQADRVAKAALMNSFLGKPKQELYDAEDE